jgi:hypothetical protein
MSNIDKPDEVAFAQAIADNLPSQKDKDNLVKGVGMAYLLGKAFKHVR